MYGWIQKPISLPENLGFGKDKDDSGQTLKPKVEAGENVYDC